MHIFSKVMKEAEIINDTALAAGQRAYFGNLKGASASYYLGQIIKRMERPILLLCPNARAADQMLAELQFFEPTLPCALFPAWETLPYDHFSPHHDLISERIKCFNTIAQMKSGVLITPVGSALHRLPPTTHFINQHFTLKRDDPLDLETLRKRLIHTGYRCVPQVCEHGEFAIRGAILDLFPMGRVQPFRIERFDDTVDSIRYFDPETQCATETVEQIHATAAREYPLTDEAITHFRTSWRERFRGNPLEAPIYKSISQGIALPGIEYYLPLFFSEMDTLFDYLPPETTVAHDGDCYQAAVDFSKNIEKRYEQLRHNITRPILPPKELFLSASNFFEQCHQKPQIHIQSSQVKCGPKDFNFATETPPNLSPQNARATKLRPEKQRALTKNPLSKLNDYINTHLHKKTIVIAAESMGRKEVLLELLKTIDKTPVYHADWASIVQTFKTPGFHLCVAPLGRGMVTEHCILITETQLFGHEFVTHITQKATDPATLIRHLAELQIDTPIVHIDHGVGRYKGLKTLTTTTQTAEFLMLEYAGGDYLYVPIQSLHLIHRYSNANRQDSAPLHKLGHEQWHKTREKAQRQACDVAAELLETDANRAARQGFAFPKPDQDYDQFARAFPFRETSDQIKAIDEVIGDMTSSKPMDRLVCGDVGFGKTEVAMRAAFLAAAHGKQVMMLVPTTLLAQQHYDSFRDRFTDTAICIDMVSRFRSTKAQNETLKKLAEGDIDIVIGTHKLIQKNVKPQNLGLVIIDEEHRFGVQQKEHLKALRAEVDILSLTATPIPRTLNMAFSELRALSIIATPPERRLAIQTSVHEKQIPLIKEAIDRELMRGGQVYYLQNQVDRMPQTLKALQALFPDTRFAMAHGQMKERALENIMVDFYHHRISVLVCSTIIETGIDVPSANTIIIERADQLGLAQLHQLRGRVGRSHHQAYAYLLTEKKMTRDAEHRLDVLSQFEELGSGFTLATYDLEIRGAGNLLGQEQSGQIHSVGFSLYMELLERATVALKNGESIDTKQPLYERGTEIDLQIPALIPDRYLGDVSLRLGLYKRISNAKTEADLKALQIEMIDRFGLLPDETKSLFEIMSLKLEAEPLGISKIEIGPRGGKLEFMDHPHLDPQQLVKLIQNPTNGFQFSNAATLRFQRTLQSPADRIIFAEKMIRYLKKTD